MRGVFVLATIADDLRPFTDASPRMVYLPLVTPCVLIESSKDILYIVLAFCALWLTIFLSWLLYYAVGIVRDASQLLRHVRRIVDAVESFTGSVHDKMERSISNLGTVAEAIKGIALWVIQKKMGKTFGTDDDEDDDELRRKKKKRKKDGREADEE